MPIHAGPRRRHPNGVSPRNLVARGEARPRWRRHADARPPPRSSSFRVRAPGHAIALDGDALSRGAGVDVRLRRQGRPLRARRRARSSPRRRPPRAGVTLEPAARHEAGAARLPPGEEGQPAHARARARSRGRARREAGGVVHVERRPRAHARAAGRPTHEDVRVERILGAPAARGRAAGAGSRSLRGVLRRRRGDL